MKMSNLINSLQEYTLTGSSISEDSDILQRELDRSAFAGDISGVKKAISKGADPDWLDGAVLNSAIKGGDVSTFEYLSNLVSNYDPSLFLEVSLQPIIGSGNMKMMKAVDKFLMDNGGFRWSNWIGKSAFPNLDTLKVAIGMGIVPDAESTILLAANRKDREMFRYALEHYGSALSKNVAERVLYKIAVTYAVKDEYILKSAMTEIGGMNDYFMRNVKRKNPVAYKIAKSLGANG